MKFNKDDINRLQQMSEADLYAVNSVLHIICSKLKLPLLLEPVAAEVARRKNWQPTTTLGYEAPIKYQSLKVYKNWCRENRRWSRNIKECFKLLEQFSFWPELQQTA